MVISCWYNLALGTWNVTSLTNTEPELLCEVEWHTLETVELIRQVKVRLSSVYFMCLFDLSTMPEHCDEAMDVLLRNLISDLDFFF